VRLGLQTTYGSDFEGGHASTSGLDPSGAVVTVPLHRHEVAIDFVRLELVGAYTFADGWDLVGRLPYDWKEREASVRLLESATPDEVAAIEAGAESHHGDAHLEGFGDATLLVARRWSDVWSSDDRVNVSLGVSLPTGATEEDPLAAGELGLPHEHVQFGSGTFDPVLEAAWQASLVSRWRVGSSFAMRAPLSTSSTGYRGPLELSATARLDFDATDQLVLSVGAVAYGQGHARWNDERDENTGLFAIGALLGASRTLGSGLVARFDVLLPLHQEALDDEGDAYENGVLVQFGLTWNGRLD
jgi:hypothetical protein